MMDHLQYPAAVFGILGALLTTSRRARVRFLGFVFYLLSNVFMLSWATWAGAWGVLGMFGAYTGISTFGAINNRRP